MAHRTRNAIILGNMLLVPFLFMGCKENSNHTKTEIAAHAKSKPVLNNGEKKELSAEFKNYWYAGNAEITSYELKQARYGEIREGSAVLIYVTEPFVAEKQVKADDNYPDNIPVLKLNSTKKFLTGIYPYSIMTSSFYPVHDNQHALKVTFSSQEWCGHVYTQLNNRSNFEINSYSYFESEGDRKFNLDKTVLENELWNKIRIAPTDLPVGKLQIIPSFEFIRLAHKELRPYTASATLTFEGAQTVYEITFPELDRKLRIHFTTTFPYTIERWDDSYKSGFGENATMLTSTATKIKTLKTPYWQQNKNKDLSLRDSLGL